MALKQSTLADELKAMSLYSKEKDAIPAWATAFATYFEDAESNKTPIIVAAIPVAKTAMEAGLIGMSLPGAGAAKIAAGLVAFWGALIPATAWPTTTLITPPVLLAGLPATLQTTFTANTVGELSKDVSMGAIATTIHTANLGGTATWPSIGPMPIT